MAHCRYYVCEDTGQEFTGDEQDDLWTNGVYGQWRAKHGVPSESNGKMMRAIERKQTMLEM